MARVAQSGVGLGGHRRRMRKEGACYEWTPISSYLPYYRYLSVM